MSAGAALLVAAAGWPVLLGLLFALPRLRQLAVTLTPTLALPALAVAFAGEPAMELQAPGLFTSMRLGVDPVGRPFLLLTALLWSVAGWHAASYTRDDPRRTTFAGFFLATGAGNIGLTLAQDALSFYLFFAVMTFAAYGLVVHTRSPAALRAGRVYISMAVLGEAMILAGLFAVTALAVDASFEHVPGAWAAMARPGVVALLLFAGFGVKAGIIPLHLWLPLAHPVAPTPASALLSGAMIKAGVLGWLRFLPFGAMPLPTAGVVAMTVGVLATLAAAAVGITQRDVKTVLAYSSISQMGFLAVGVGAALLLPAAAPVLVLAVTVYAIHHALAKAALFLAVSVVPGSRRPLLLLAAALPGLVLAGAPLSSGAVAKSALKAALGEGRWPVPVDTLLSLAAVGTTLLMARYLSLLAITPDHGSGARRPAAGQLTPWLVLVALSVAAAGWLPMVLAPLGELPLATDPGYIAAALWPLALGALLAGASVFLTRRYPALTVQAVPAGDIIALLERSAARLRRAAAPLLAITPGDTLRRTARRSGDRAAATMDRASAAYERVAAGPVLGAVFVLVAALLFLALR
jgi:formate hydrogenlyase subunit 3/multisubunit Na+/H+ antiporter MnhD subunit